MIGTVENRHALLPVLFLLPGRPELSLEFVIDTGFTGELTLPLAAAAALGLSYSHTNVIYTASIRWEGSERLVGVLATGRRPLLGTALLDDYDLYARFREGGPLTVTAIEDAA